jgi:SAM-dependent MidA family methyltransferase
MNLTNLPTLDENSLIHSKKFIEYIGQKIGSNFISFAEFMNLALYTPNLGYYSGNLPKFGEQGDFVTAPEISPLFSRCLARACIEKLSGLDNSSILEFGAGSGIMAADLLLELEAQNCLPKNYFILELSANLQTHQYKTLQQKASHLFSKINIKWLQTLPETAINGVILANEVLDAMPVNLFKIKQDNIEEFHVKIENNEFKWHIEKTKNKQLIQAIKNLNIEFPDNYISEINLALPTWLKAVVNVLNRGMILLIDYGFSRREYYHPQRNNGTLMCHYKHHAHDNPLIYVGLQDITAHVDFDTIIENAKCNNLEVSEYTNQANFLMANGLEDMLLESKPEKFKEHLSMTQQVKKLILPSEMGELFKVIQLTAHGLE